MDRKMRTAATIISLCFTVILYGQQAIITVDADKPGKAVSPTLHGIFFEEISHAGEGGLYAELIQNRGFEEVRLPPGTHLEGDYIVPERTAHFSIPGNQPSDWKMEWPLKSQWPAWSMQQNGGTDMRISLTTEHPLNKATPHSLRVDIYKKGRQADLVNEGFWGIHAVAGEKYNGSFYVRTAGTYKGTITVSLQSDNGEVLAADTVSMVKESSWHQYHCSLMAAKSDAKARFVLSFGSKGTLWVDFVSLFPENTFLHRPNGLRKDLAEYIAGLKPAFIRWPGGCFVEGICIQSAPDWKRTIGPVERRPGTYSPWGYWTSDGFGFHEYLQYCEDIGAAALYVFNAGVSCDFRSGTFVPDDSLQPYVQSALDAIEYAIGPASSKWGKVRAGAGHPAPFPLKYVEIGNEQTGPRYARRYNLFYDAIKRKYPQIQIIASMGIGDVNSRTLDSMRRVELADEHAYKGAFWAMTHFDHFDKYKRGNWNMYVGEYATNGGVGNGNMIASLSDAVYIMSMEKNSDLVKMSSYAPLLVNVNDVDWPVNLINFNASQSFARISYYVIKMMNEHRAEVNLPTRLQVLPPAVQPPAFSGGIGLATWDTHTEYRDIKVVEDGKTVYQSDFVHKPSEWNLLRGKWQVMRDSGLAEMADGPQRLAILKDRSFDHYTLTMKARKLDGYNAFIIPFAVKDSNTFLRAHIGSYVNVNCVFERVTNGFDVSDISSQKRLVRPIETGRWYDIRLEVGLDKVDCYLDDTLIMSYKEPASLFAIAGKDNDNGDIILKVVNSAASVCEATLRLDGLRDSTVTTAVTTLSAPSGDVENSFDHPDQYTPQETTLSQIFASGENGLTGHIELKPFSISILRIRSGKERPHKSTSF
jgi:alpha-L-arabinofuranosidase